MKHSLKDGSGYLEIDHTESPGISYEDVPNLIRESTIPVPKGKRFESDVQQCSHCQRMVVLNKDRTRARAYCSNCDHYVCDSCETLRIKVGCIPFIKQLEKIVGG